MRCELPPELNGPKCKAKVKSVYFNHPSQGNSTKHYIILGPRDKAAPPTSQQTGLFPPKRVKYRHHLLLFFSLFFFSSLFSLIHRRALFALNQSHARFAELREYSRDMLNEAFWTRSIASSQFDEYSKPGSRSKISPSL